MSYDFPFGRPRPTEIHDMREGVVEVDGKTIRIVEQGGRVIRVSRDVAGQLEALMIEHSRKGPAVRLGRRKVPIQHLLRLAWPNR